MAAAAVIVLGVGGFGLLAARRRRFSGSTLMAAWWWSIASWTAIVAAECWRAFADDPASPRIAAFRYVAAVGALCPLAAVLGAKRPQDKPWQFIVLSLWLVLSLPAAQTLWVRYDSPPSPPGALTLFILAISAAGVWNGLGTRYMATAIAAGAGQLLLFAPHAFSFIPHASATGIAAMALMAVAFALALVADRASTSVVSPLDGTWLAPLDSTWLAPLDVAWLEFRDAYGAFWASRVLDRMNAAGKSQSWGVELTWSGFRPIDAQRQTMPSDAPNRQLVQALVNLLRRFVSPEWIAARLGPDLE